MKNLSEIKPTSVVKACPKCGHILYLHIEGVCALCGNSCHV